MKILIPTLCAMAISLATISSVSAADDPQHNNPHQAAFEACAKACGECALMCDMCSAHCAKMLAEGKKEHLRTLQTCQDCATHCAAAACIVGRGGPFSDLICTACAEACKRCGEECEKFKDDPMMKKCAKECFECEKACREMLKHTKASSQQQ